MCAACARPRQTGEHKKNRPSFSTPSGTGRHMAPGFDRQRDKDIKRRRHAWKRPENNRACFSLPPAKKSDKISIEIIKNHLSNRSAARRPERPGFPVAERPP